MFLVATAHNAFYAEDNPTSAALAEHREDNLVAFMNLVVASIHYA